MNSLPGTGRTARPVPLARVVRRQQQQQLGLQRIGVLELVHEDARAPRLQRRAHAVVVAHQIARAVQQVEEVELAAPRLQLLVAVEAARSSSRSSAARSASASRLKMSSCSTSSWCAS